ncbi:EthD family reductase [Rhodoblastus sp.]|uniref:EthD family reductase n=1 Tax=Rhodoblastus sp. TaxID=1962975 RepID=UPI003F992DB4
MIKLTALYGHPTDPAAFESYYAAKHMPVVAKLSGFVRAETSKVFATPSGEKPPYYRMAEFWFESEAAMAAAMGSPEGRAVEGDLANFATGGVTILISAVE